MKLHLLKKVVLGVAMLLCETTMCYAQDSETTLNQKYWNMRERFRKYYVSLGADKGQGIPASKRQAGSFSGNRCGTLYGTSAGFMSWGDATSYIGDYMCTLATEYALLTQEGKSTKATLNELYYALNAIDRLDGFAEKTFNNSYPIDYNGFFLRDDVEQSTVGKWNYEFDNVGVIDPWLNYRCASTDHYSNLDIDLVLNQQGQLVPRGSVATNEPSFDQISNILTGFSFIKKYVPNVYVKPMSTDAGFNIIDKMQAITANIMEYMSGADRQLQRLDHGSELIFNYVAHPTPAIFGPGTPLSFALNASLGYLIADSDCGDNDIRGNWILVNPVTGRKVGVESNDTKGQDIRLFAYTFAKIAENLTGDNQYLGRDIHHQSIDHLGDGYYCLSKHDYHIPLSTVSVAWNLLENMPSVPEDLVFSIGPPITSGVFSKPLAFKLSSFPRNFYIFECLGSTSGTWSHANVNKFASFYGHENMDLVYSCLNNESPLNSKQHYIDLLSKMPCDGNRNYGQGDFTSFWNNGNNFEQPNPNDIIDPTATFDYGEYNANDWMWLYNMYRLKFGDTSFPNYEDVSCNCKKSPMLDLNTNQQTGVLNTSITLKRVFKDYLKLGISLKEFNQGVLYIQNNKTLTNETELTVCGQVYVSGNSTLINTGKPTNEDSIKITVRNSSGLFIQNNGTLDIGNNTKVVIQKGGQLISNGTNSKIIVRSGGKLIIEPGAFLELNNGSKLIVEDGGQVIIQADLSNPNATVNGLLTYNQGAIIQLKGDNAVLEINGRLHIGDNATFGFTYPGSNSGYIKFNRGQGVWWDNWAPNNAHITCGINSRINLQGQSKTDKMIDISQIDLAIPKNLAFFTMAKCQVDFNVSDAMLETDRPTIINNSTFIRGNAINGRAGRGLLVFGQPTCIINNCDFIKLFSGITGALFYSGTKLTGVKGCNFSECGQAFITYGGGASVINNSFFDNAQSLFCVDMTANSFAKNNTINLNIYSLPLFQASGLGSSGANVEFDVRQNTINNQYYAVSGRNTETKLLCNDLQNNVVALLTGENSKTNMSDMLGGGYNNANNCEFAAKFIEAGTFEADQGFNNFQIANGGPCIPYPQSGHGPNITPAYTVCPTIMEGSLINFIDFNPTPFSHNYQIFAEQNFWRPLTSTTDIIEDRQNKVRKIDLTDLNNPIIDSASIFTGNVLTDFSQITCPGSNGGSGIGAHQRVHPLDNNSNSAIITTASFYNEKLHKALKFSLNKMDKMQNSTKVNQAADLFTECLKYNYATPVTNSVDKYLLELAYQKLFTCVAQLAEWHRDSAITFNPMPASLQTRFNDLHTICALRVGRKDITEKDYKEISDLILLDKAMVYRISDNHQNALNIVNNIIAGSPKATHLNMYESFRCMWSTEIDAINGSISTEKALEQLKLCNEKYSSLPKQTTTTARKTNLNQASGITYANEYAIAVYPNPTNGNLSIAYSLGEFKSIKLEIFDVQGKLMSTYNLNPEDKTINIDNLNLGNGVYFYSIKGDEKTLMAKKLVVLK